MVGSSSSLAVPVRGSGVDPTDSMASDTDGFAAVVVRRVELTSQVVQLDFARADGDSFPAWSAGAHIDVILDDTVRQYSLCGDPDDRHLLRIAVLVEAEGRGGSQRIHRELTEGSNVTIGAPRNNFPLVSSAAYVFIAGGIGITPIAAMLHEAELSGASWVLHYGGRTRASQVFAEELLDRYGDARVRLYPQDEVGLLDIETILDESAGSAIYCCGPEPLLLAVESATEDLGLSRPHVERFSPKEVVHGEDGSFEVEIASTGETIQIPADESILDTLIDFGLRPPFSCTEGTCGTCETRVLEGIPDHRDSVLDPDEQEANDVMMICCSRSKTPRLKLDL